jgi:hypothetical protein
MTTILNSMIPLKINFKAGKTPDLESLKKRLASLTFSDLRRLVKKVSSERCCSTSKDYVDDESVTVEVGLHQDNKSFTAIELQQMFSSKVDNLTFDDFVDGNATLNTSDLTDENLSDNLGETWLADDDTLVLNYSFSDH